MLQEVQFEEKDFFWKILMIFAILSPKNHHFGNIYQKNGKKFTKLVILDAKKSSKFEENSKININFVVPKNDHPVALRAQHY